MEIEEQWIADAVKYLLNIGEETTALFLLDCSLKLQYHDTAFPSDVEVIDLFTVGIECSPRQYDVLKNEEHEMTIKLKKSLSLTQPDNIGIVGNFDGIPGFVSSGCYPILRQEKHPENWRDQYKEAILGQTIHNQGLPEDKSGKYRRYQWNNFELGSIAELEIAKELDKRKLIFFPNSRARVKLNDSACNVIPDFIVCCNGKWGILQCDHQSTHPYAAEDHNKDRYFRIHGVKVIERYDYEKCVHHAQDVVDEFLQLLSQNG